MQITTLDELKQQNALGEESAEDTSSDVEETELLDDSSAEATPENDDPEVAEASEEVAQESESEFWQQEEGLEDSRTVPLNKHIQVRSNLKDKLRDSKFEIEELRRELEQFKTAQTKPILTRPKLKDFDNHDDPEESYAQATQDYLLAKMREESQAQAQENRVAEENYRERERIKKSVENHYQRAADLVSEGKVTEGAYQNADSVVRGLIANKFGEKQADSVADMLISALDDLGEGSERVWYLVGNNQKAFRALEDKLRKDSTGLSAVAYLASLHSQVKSPRKLNTAPAPSKALKDGAPSPSKVGGSLYKKYQKAVAAGDIQARLDLRGRAKEAGIDISKW